MWPLVHNLIFNLPNRQHFGRDKNSWQTPQAKTLSLLKTHTFVENQTLALRSDDTNPQRMVSLLRNRGCSCCNLTLSSTPIMLPGSSCTSKGCSHYYCERLNTCKCKLTGAGQLRALCLACTPLKAQPAYVEQRSARLA